MALRGQLVDGYARTKHPLFWTWYNMIKRCENPSHNKFQWYGGRGIKVCERWHDFALFVEDVGIPPSDKHTLDRFPNRDGNYEPGNTRWATTSEQFENRTIQYKLPPLAVPVPSAACKALRAAVAKTGAGCQKFANLFPVNIIVIRMWLTGDVVPAHHHRIAIQRLTGIPASAWMTDAEYQIAYGRPRPGAQADAWMTDAEYQIAYGHPRLAIAKSGT